jgi:hypothetical protein
MQDMLKQLAEIGRQVSWGGRECWIVSSNASHLTLCPFPASCGLVTHTHHRVSRWLLEASEHRGTR